MVKTRKSRKSKRMRKTMGGSPKVKPLTKEELEEKEKHNNNLRKQANGNRFRRENPLPRISARSVSPPKNRSPPKNGTKKSWFSW